MFWESTNCKKGVLTMIHSWHADCARDGKIMWRYFEQQSFYMEEEEFANHCQAVAELLRGWKAVDYFCDYVSSCKKRRKFTSPFLNRIYREEQNDI